MRFRGTTILFALLALAARPVAAGTPVPGTPVAAAPMAGAGTYVVERVNGHGLPFTDTFSTTAGYEHRLRVERVLVRLDARGTFSMSVRGAYKAAPRTLPPGEGAAMDEVVRGRWTRQGRTVTLTPDATKKGKRYAPATGELTGERLVLGYQIFWGPNGTGGSRRYVLGATHDPSYW